MVNHELRNALSAVYGWSEMLVRKRDPATVPRAAFEVLDSARHAIGLINDLLDLSRLDEDRLKPDIGRSSRASMARRAIAPGDSGGDLKGISFDVAPDAGFPTAPPTRGGSSRSSSICSATRSSTLPSGAPSASVSPPATRVVYTVEDDGPGVPPGEVEAIFDIYVTKAGEESRGLGLGLPLSRRLARLLGGELRAVARPGQGGCFILEVPVMHIVKRSSRWIPASVRHVLRDCGHEDPRRRG